MGFCIWQERPLEGATVMTRSERLTDMMGCVRFVCVSRPGLFSFVPITKTMPWSQLSVVYDQPADLIYIVR